MAGSKKNPMIATSKSGSKNISGPATPPVSTQVRNLVEVTSSNEDSAKELSLVLNTQTGYMIPKENLDSHPATVPKTGMELSPSNCFKSPKTPSKSGLSTQTASLLSPFLTPVRSSNRLARSSDILPPYSNSKSRSPSFSRHLNRNLAKEISTSKPDEGETMDASVGVEKTRDENSTQYIKTVKNESEDFFRDCSSNLHKALKSINTNAKDWLDVGREGAHVGIMLVVPGTDISRPPRLITVIGYVNVSYLSKPSAVGSGQPSWSIILVISETTFKDLLQLVSTGARKVYIGKDGQPNFYVPFRKVDGHYELKLRAKVAYFEAIRIARIQEQSIYEREALKQVAAARGYDTDEETQFRHYNGNLTEQNSVPNVFIQPGTESGVVDGKYEDSETIDSNIELPDIESKDWRNCPFPHIYNSTTIPTQENAGFITTNHSEIVPKCLVAARCFTQFWDFGVDGKQRTGYSMQLESLHLINYSSDHRADLIPKTSAKRKFSSMNGIKFEDSQRSRQSCYPSVPPKVTYSDL